MVSVGLSCWVKVLGEQVKALLALELLSTRREGAVRRLGGDTKS